MTGRNQQNGNSKDVHVIDFSPDGAGILGGMVDWPLLCWNQAQLLVGGCLDRRRVD